MKFINRSSVPEPDSLDLSNPESNASKELRAARAFLRTTSKNNFQFGAYKKGIDVSNSLNSLFQGICAYCESNFESTSPGDVEHYRPKSKVKEEKAHPGYWWLAADWKNLLMSCTDCTRGRYHNYYDATKAECLLSEKKQIQGKECSFPVLGPSYAMHEGEDLEQEDPLLIDPTKRNPEDHLEWKIINKLPLLTPITCGDQSDPYGKATIEILGLNRRGLVEHRLSTLEAAQISLSFIQDDFIEIAQSTDENEIRKSLHKAMFGFEKIYRLAETNKPYASMIKSYLDMEKEKLIQHYSELLSKLQDGNVTAENNGQP